MKDKIPCMIFVIAVSTTLSVLITKRMNKRKKKNT